MSEIIWEPPPPNPKRASQLDEGLEQVQANPGEWARLRLYETQAAAYGARRRLVKNHGNDERWEFRVARVEEEYGLWARYRDEGQMSGLLALPALAFGALWDWGYGCWEWEPWGIEVDVLVVSALVLALTLGARALLERAAFLRASR